ncbi:uncharacterized protein BXIN_0187 [Babesia sp. Xinjiang]|uniref:uncharacterized protein n=1 Tax=Babesia sp. Xinjiang TaxID=462227 RepID=UPI000A258471|nr:uncharacterized protein BXIN_0187 [Babesia sp. Xinjiang]ORM39857.1 hypothetical protein BXIN_0187 [Babesia sp. Xinjiang]
MAEFKIHKLIISFLIASMLIYGNVMGDDIAEDGSEDAFGSTSADLKRRYPNDEVDRLVDPSDVVDWFTRKMFRKDAHKYLIDHDMLDRRRDEIRQAMENFQGKLDLLPVEVAREVVKYKHYADITSEIKKQVEYYVEQSHFDEFVSTLPPAVAAEFKKYSTFSKIPKDIGDRMYAYYEHQLVKDLITRVEELSREVEKIRTHEKMLKDIKKSLQPLVKRTYPKHDSNIIPGF